MQILLLNFCIFESRIFEVISLCCDDRKARIYLVETTDGETCGTRIAAGHRSEPPAISADRTATASGGRQTASSLERTSRPVRGRRRSQPSLDARYQTLAGVERETASDVGLNSWTTRATVAICTFYRLLTLIRSDLIVSKGR